jgi:magnesium transporter
MLPSYVARLCAYWSLDSAAGLFADFNASSTAAILRCISKPKRDDLLKALPERHAALCRLLLSYSDDSVGAWMSADIALLPPNCLVDEALQRFTLEDSSVLGDAMLLVDNKNCLIGQVFLRSLLRAKGKSLVSHLRQDAPPALSSRTSLAAAARHGGWQHYDTLPVLNRDKQLIGLLRHVDLRRSLEQFGETSRGVSQDDLLGEMGEAYRGTLIALLGLLNKPKPGLMMEKSS